jgi:uncharacterized repeat protein (TIGR02543 family)
MVELGDEITYTVSVDKPEPEYGSGAPDGGYDFLFLLNRSSYMTSGQIGGMTAVNYARELMVNMSKRIAENYPGSRLSVMATSGMYNNRDLPQFLNIQVDTHFGDPKYSMSVIPTGTYSFDLMNFTCGWYDNGQTFAAGIEKMQGDKVTNPVFYGSGVYNVSSIGNNASDTLTLKRGYIRNPRDKMDSGRPPVIIYMSDFTVLEEYDWHYNDQNRKYWSDVMKGYSDRFSNAFPGGILMTVRLDHDRINTGRFDFTSAEYDNYMKNYVSPAGRDGWSFTKLAKNVAPANALKEFEGTLLGSNPPTVLKPVNMKVTDVVPEGLTILGTNPPATVSGQTVTWDLAGLPSGPHDLSVMTKVTGPNDTYNNTATISIEGRPDYNTNTTYHKLNDSDPEFDVKYLANGGTGEYTDPDQSSILPYIVKGLGETGISFENHSFDGWNTEADGSGDAYAAGDSIMLAGDLVLYAQWTPYARITYHPGFRGVGGKDDFAPVGELYTVKDEIWAQVYSDPVYVPRPYNFDYWNTDFNGAGASYDPGGTFVVTGDIVLYALWYRIT